MDSRKRIDWQWKDQDGKRSSRKKKLARFFRTNLCIRDVIGGVGRRGRVTEIQD